MKREDGSVVQESVYIGLCEHGKARAICVDLPEYREHTASDIAEWIKDGLTVQRVTGEEGRAAIQFRCEPCERGRGKAKR